MMSAPSPEAHSRSPLRVLMTATSYPTSETDWKGLFIRRLVEAMARHDDIGLRLWAPPGPVADGVFEATSAEERQWLAGLMAEGGIAHLLRTNPLRGLFAGLRLMRYLRRAYARNDDVELYHVNWLQNALALPDDGKPALLTALGTDMQLLGLPGMKRLIRRALRGRRAAICPNAEWMVGPLNEALGDVARIQYLPFGIDPRWFNIQRVPVAEGPCQWLVVSRLTRGKLGPLFEWSEPVFRERHRELHLFGPMQETLPVPDWVRYHGPATPEVLANQWFPRASGLLTLSEHAEGRPQVMLEAMASGLPIVASRLPAHEDLLLHRVTGWICSTRQDLAGALAEAEDAGTSAAVGGAARQWAQTKVGTWDDSVRRYTTLYSDLMP